MYLVIVLHTHVATRPNAKVKPTLHISVAPTKRENTMNMESALPAIHVTSAHGQIGAHGLTHPVGMEANLRR